MNEKTEKKSESKNRDTISQPDMGLSLETVSPGIHSGLQSTLGNQWALRFIRSGVLQTKLNMSSPGDPYEQEADRVAERIMRMPEPLAPHQDDELHFQEKKNGLSLRSSPLSRIPEKNGGASNEEILPETESRINQLKGRGTPLSDTVRAYMEPRFGADFSQVRIHTDASAVQAASEVNAQAFTVGSDIAFGTGLYAPESENGKRLLAHELTHVLQQRGTTGSQLCRDPNPAAKEEKEEWVRLEVYATGMDEAALTLAKAELSFHGAEDREFIFIGLHPKFLKIYNKDGRTLARIPLKKVQGLRFNPGIYVQVNQNLVALTESTKDPGKISAEDLSGSIVGQREFTSEEKQAIAEEEKKAETEGRKPKAPPVSALNLEDIVTDPDLYRSQLRADAVWIYFVPTYTFSGSGGKDGGESAGIYSSPIEGRGDGFPPNAPSWPVSLDGPVLVPADSNPTYAAKINWSANGNNTLLSQVASQVGTTIHYKWELFNITSYARKLIAKDPAGTKEAAQEKPEKSLQERIEEFKRSKAGAGVDVTGTGGADREFSREFEDWWKDTRKAAKGSNNPDGDTVGERLSNLAANRLALELAPVSLLVTSLGASLRWTADLFSGPRQQQEIPLEKKGIFLIRVITTPGINEDREGNRVIRPPSVDTRIVEVTEMDKAVLESLDEPGAQIAELQAQIDLAEKDGDNDKADYLRSLLAEARLRFEGSPHSLLTKKRDQKQKELEEFRKKYPGRSTYSLEQEISHLDDQLALFDRHQKQLDSGKSLKRVNATLISEVTGEKYPLLISAGPMSMVDNRYRWMISDVTNRDGDAFIGLGDTPSAAFLSALEKLGGQAAYGRGRIGVETSGLELEKGAPSRFFVDSAPTDWALAEKRIDDLVMTLAALGLIVSSAGTAGAVIGAGLAAARLIKRWQAGKLYLDSQTVNDVLGVLGGLGAAGQLAAGLRVQKFGKHFAIIQEGKATEAQFAAAAEVLNDARQLAKGIEYANEAINYGGLVWGNISFVDQIISINEQEQSGAITHAAARRARAGAISSAVQNNGLFLAGNVLKAKQKVKDAEMPAEKNQRPSDTDENAGNTEERAPEKTGPEQRKVPETEESQTPSESVDSASAPIGERQATIGELKEALSSDLRDMVVIDKSLHGDDVRVDYQIDKESGLITDISVRCSPDARPGTVALHEQTVRTMQKYQGFSGRVRLAVSWVAELIGIKTGSPNPDDLKSFEAALEIAKLPGLIEAQMERMRGMEPDALNKAEAELEHMQIQLDKHLHTLELGGGGESEGFVAVKGLSKAKQKQYAELKEKLRGQQAGTEAHKKTRREMYELIGGDLPYEAWEKVYDSNVNRARKANAVVAAEHARLGWGEPEQTVKVGRDDVRRIDIADTEAKKGVEVKAYETGRISASEDITWEVERDAKLVKKGWEITWLLIDTQPSGPLLKMLLDAGITVEIRVRKGVVNEEITIIKPPAGAKTIKK